MKPRQDKPIVFFDGVCNLCNNTVQFIIRHDRQKIFLFAPLQSPMGAEAKRALNDNAADTFILFHEGEYYTKADAAIKTLSLLGKIWHAAVLLKVFPKPARNWIYDFIAKRRYKWFGKKDKCMMPTEELKARFLTA